MLKEKSITVYSCSGCSNVAQLANGIAIKLHRERLATMSCIAGVGGGVVSLVEKAKNSEKILVIDGCALSCSLQCLRNQNIIPDRHIILSDGELAKNIYTEVTEQEFEKSYNYVLAECNKLK